jgi:hypothetical protein
MDYYYIVHDIILMLKKVKRLKKSKWANNVVYSIMGKGKFSVWHSLSVYFVIYIPYLFTSLYRYLIYLVLVYGTLFVVMSSGYATMHDPVVLTAKWRSLSTWQLEGDYTYRVYKKNWTNLKLLSTLQSGSRYDVFCLCRLLGHRWRIYTCNATSQARVFEAQKTLGTRLLVM